MSILDVIRAKLATLTAKQRSIANYLLEAPDEVSYLTLKELSMRTRASEVSVLRLCKALGFDSFIALKEALRSHTQETFRAVTLPPFFMYSENRSEGTPKEQLARICLDDQNNLANMISQLDSETLFRCARNLLKAEKVVIFAHDKSFLFADYLAYRLNFLQISVTAVQLGDSDTVSTTLARLEKDDYAILFSFPPYHLPIRNVANYCHYRSTPILVITDCMDSPAVVEGSSVFLCRTGARYFFNSQVATLSFINILASCIAIEMGPQFDEILANEQDVNEFLRNNGHNEEGDEHGSIQSN